MGKDKILISLLLANTLMASKEDIQYKNVITFF